MSRRALSITCGVLAVVIGAAWTTIHGPWYGLKLLLEVVAVVLIVAAIKLES